MRNLLSLTLLLAVNGVTLAQSAPTVTFTPLPAAAAPVAAPAVNLPETPELKKTVSLTVPLGGMTLEQALTSIARAAGLSILTQGLPQATLRSGLTTMPARNALATLINLYAPNATASVQGKLLIVGDAAAVARVRGQVTPGTETRVLRVPGLTDAQLGRVQPFLQARAALFDEGVVLLSGNSNDLTAAERFLSSLPVQPQTPPAPTTAQPTAPVSVIRTYTVAGDANLLAAAIRDFTGAAVTVLGDTLAVRGTETQQQDALTILRTAPGRATTPATSANPVTRRTYPSALPESDASYLRALFDDLKVTPLPEQGLLVVEASAARHTDVASALKDADARRAGRITSYYPVDTGRAADLIPTLKREAPDADINTVDGRNMLAIRTTPTEQVRLAGLLRTLQGAPAPDTTSRQDLITRSIKLGYGDAASIAPDLTRLTLASAQVGGPATAAAGTLPQATAPGQGQQANNLTIIADTRTNSLLVSGPRDQVTEMVNAIAMIDVPVPSVRVRLRVEQVSAADAQNLGVNWKVGVGGFSLGQQGGTLSVGYSPSLNPAQLEVALNTAKTRGSGRTIIDSHFAALSGQDTQFQNGGELLFPATTSGSGQNAVVVPGQTYSYGLQIKVRPRIAPDGTVVMTLDTNLGSTPSSGPMGSVQQTKQTLTTSVQLKPGDTVVLGGIVTNTTDQSQRGVPGLSNIPVIGALFGSRTASVSNTALLFIVSAEPVTPTRPAVTESVALPAARPTPANTTPAAPATANPARTTPPVQPANERGTERIEIPAEPPRGGNR